MFLSLNETLRTNTEQILVIKVSVLVFLLVFVGLRARTENKAIIFIVWTSEIRDQLLM